MYASRTYTVPTRCLIENKMHGVISLITQLVHSSSLHISVIAPHTFLLAQILTHNLVGVMHLWEDLLSCDKDLWEMKGVISFIAMGKSSTFLLH